jgi:signal transduction histidine kinase
MRNLISNALKFTPAGKSVNVLVSDTVLPEGRRKDDADVVPGVEVRVVDEGVGIPDGELELIFDKFIQSSKTKSGAGGTGLGLAISREIAHHHGGYIVASHNPRGGAVFRLAVRKVPMPETAAPAADFAEDRGALR